MLAPAAAIAGLCAAASLANASVTYFDGVFNPSDWNDFTILGPGNGFSSGVTVAQLPFGGNPGSYRQIDIVLDAQLPGAAVTSLNINNNAFYNPVTQGAISFIDYSEDSLAVLGGGNVQGTGLLIVQNGNYFVQRNPVLVMPFSSHSSWAPNAAPGLVASDLWELLPSGLLDSTSNPDFSAAGGIMQLGFWRGVSSGGFSGGVDNRHAAIDNWRVRIVPTPGTAAVGLIAGTLLAARRRRVNAAE